MKSYLPISYISNKLRDQLTILILTYNRYQHLYRLLEYFHSYQPTPNLIILDSSSDDIVEDFPEEFMNDQKILWKKFAPNTFFIDKINDGLKEVKTQFSVLCADDDFLAIHGLLRAVDFLEKHSDYVCTMGYCISHGIDVSQKPHSFFWGPLFYETKAAKEDNPIKRMKKYATGQTIMNLYGVYRTRIHQKIWKNTCEYVSDWGLAEIHPCMLSYFYGKVAILNVFFWSNERNLYQWATEERKQEMYSKEKLNQSTQGLTAVLMSENSFPEFGTRYQAFQLLLTYIIRVFPLEFYDKKMFSKNDWITKKLFSGIQRRCYRLYYQFVLNNRFSSNYIDFCKIKSSVESHLISTELLERTRKEYESQGKK